MPISSACVRTCHELRKQRVFFSPSGSAVSGCCTRCPASRIVSELWLLLERAVSPITVLPPTPTPELRVALTEFAGQLRAEGNPQAGMFDQLAALPDASLVQWQTRVEDGQIEPTYPQ